MNNQPWNSGVPNDEWDKEQATTGAHFLQSSAWAAFQVALGRQVFYAAGKDWSWLAILERNRLGTRLYCPYGPTVQNTAGLRAATKVLTQCAKAHGAILARIEPVGPIQQTQLHRYFIKSPRDIQPKNTWIKSLRASEDELIAEMQATNRNLHRTAAKKGISFRKSDDPADITIMLDLLHAVASRNQIALHSDHYFATMADTLLPRRAASLYFAEFENKPIAAAIVFDSKTTRYYAHAAASFAHRKLHPGTPLVSHMILDAKREGKKQFDFYGIAPPGEPQHPWAGFSAFKQSFGGQAVSYAGTWEVPIKKLPYLLYSTFRKML